MPALRRIPPAHSAVVSQKIGAGLMWLGGSAIFFLGVSGFSRAWILGELPFLFSADVMRDSRLEWTSPDGVFVADASHHRHAFRLLVRYHPHQKAPVLRRVTRPRGAPRRASESFRMAGSPRLHQPDPRDSSPPSAESWRAADCMSNALDLTGLSLLSRTNGWRMPRGPGASRILRISLRIIHLIPLRAGCAMVLAPKFSLQLEATGDPPIWIALDPPELDRWAGVIERMWTRWGTSPGETIAFFEYGSSPLVLLTSSGYVGYLRRGAADRLRPERDLQRWRRGDGGPHGGDHRNAEALDADRSPRSQLPLRDGSGSRRHNLAGRVRWLAISEVEGAVSRTEAVQFSARLGVPVWRILRSDAAFLLSGECPELPRVSSGSRVSRRDSGGRSRRDHRALRQSMSRSSLSTSELRRSSAAAVRASLAPRGWNVETRASQSHLTISIVFRAMRLRGGGRENSNARCSSPSRSCPSIASASSPPVSIPLASARSKIFARCRFATKRICFHSRAAAAFSRPTPPGLLRR